MYDYPFFLILISISTAIIEIYGGVISDVPSNNKNDVSTLIQLHVLFRHGNRTPNGPEELYPRDPFINENYHPFGLGQLTNVGKQREFGIGKALRSRYDHFLGDYYFPQVLEAQSTDYNRTKMSLMLVLASLYPPKGIEIWNRQFNWQPIPYNYVTRNKDKVLLGVLCPNYVRLYEEYLRTPNHRSDLVKHKEVFDYITTNSGRSVTTYRDMYNLNFGLTTEHEWGYRLPKWTDKVWPGIMNDLAAKEYAVAVATTPLRQMAVGYFLKKITDDITAKISSKVDNSPQIYLYSAHESNLGQLLTVLNILGTPHIPNYGSYVTIEVHRIKGIVGLKIYYENYTSHKPQLLKLPACDSFCPFIQFVTLIEEYFPLDNMCDDFYWNN